MFKFPALELALWGIEQQHGKITIRPSRFGALTLTHTIWIKLHILRSKDYCNSRVALISSPS